LRILVFHVKLNRPFHQGEYHEQQSSRLLFWFAEALFARQPVRLAAKQVRFWSRVQRLWLWRDHVDYFYRPGVLDIIGHGLVTVQVLKMHKRKWAHKTFHSSVFPLVALFAFLMFFLDSGPAPVSAQELSPTPESATPAGTLTVIPEIPTPSPVSVSYPIHGITLTGVVNITGSIALEGWTHYEVAFSYVAEGNDVWFVFAGGTNPVAENSLASWTTTAISDGDYNLRVRVFSPGSFQDGFVYGLRVRNYTVNTPLPTSTFTPTATSAATAPPTFTPTLTSTVYPTPTALPTNPATLGTREIVLNLGGGALAAVVLFGVFGLFIGLRSSKR
jgi:hypothetical protein